MKPSSQPTIDEPAQTPTKTPSGPAIRPADAAADSDAVLALWSRNLPEGTADRYHWLYAEGPARQWVATAPGKSAVASIGLLERRMRLFGEEHPCGQPIDLNVDRPYRLGWLALRLQGTIAQQVDQGRLSLAYGLPNAQSEAVARRAGYAVVGPLTRWARPLRAYDYLHDRLPGHGVGRAMAAAVDAAVTLRSPESRYYRRREHRVEVTDVFDERFDHLWQRAARQFPIIGRRTADYLNWRFRDAPHTVYRTLCLGDRNDRLLAYLVYTCHDDVAYIADFLHADESFGDAVLAEFVKMMRVQKAKAIVTVFTGAPSIVRRLRRFGFSRRPSSWKIMLHVDAIRLGIPRYKFLDVTNWFLTRADIDTEF
ncbi:MAG: hypothetical protein JW719_05920 [Pirellulales bacterium]|nr:hypothetical protein [Pirellulales bacterium]